MRYLSIALCLALAGPAVASAQTPAEPTQAEKDAEFRADTIATGTPGLTNPVLIREAKPSYSREALDARIQGSVTIEAVVLADGTVGRARIAKSLDEKFGLDAAALEAARKWVFEPAKLNGKAVAVPVMLLLDFNLNPR